MNVNLTFDSRSVLWLHKTNKFKFNVLWVNLLIKKIVRILFFFSHLLLMCSVLTVFNRKLFQQTKKNTNIYIINRLRHVCCRNARHIGLDSSILALGQKLFYELKCVCMDLRSGSNDLMQAEYHCVHIRTKYKWLRSNNLIKVKSHFLHIRTKRDVGNYALRVLFTNIVDWHMNCNWLSFNHTFTGATYFGKTS